MGEEKSDEEQLMDMFRQFDKSGDGKLSASEMKEAAVAMGGSVDDVDMIMKMADLDGDKMLSYEEMANMMGLGPKGKDPKEKKRAAFRMMDSNGDGSITADELKVMMGSLGDDDDLGIMEMLIKEHDKDGDGKLSFEEFDKFFK